MPTLPTFEFNDEFEGLPEIRVGDQIVLQANDVFFYKIRASVFEMHDEIIAARIEHVFDGHGAG